MSRAKQKMIGIYVPENLHESIKKAAQERGMTIKEYLVSLHRKEINSSTEILEEIRRKADRILALVGESAPKGRTSRKVDPQKEMVATLNEPLLVYLEQFRSIPRQYNALKETLEILVRHGGSATSVQIKEGRGFSRTTLIKGQVKRLAEDGVVSVDHSRKPFVVILSEQYR